MAQIIENSRGRRMIKLNTDDILSIIREYQSLTYGLRKYGQIREKLDNSTLFLPED